jgi:hypothetical protein
MRSMRFPTQLNERAARLNAAFVVATILPAWLTSSTWILPLLALGFVLRATLGPRFSPLGRAASALAARLWPTHVVAAAPKRFAQGIGAVCLTAAALLAFTGHAPTGWALAGVVAVFATLEAALGFCMGCWIYGRLQATGLFGPAVCIDCGPIKAVSPETRPARTDEAAIVEP